jgi:predicted nucleotidyltransferase
MTRGIYTIDEIKSKVSEVATRHGAERVYLFGSYARGQAKPDSDVDLLIDKGKIKGLFALSGFLLDLEDTLKLPVDLLTSDGINEKFKNNIRSEEILLYEFKQ